MRYASVLSVNVLIAAMLSSGSFAQTPGKPAPAPAAAAARPAASASSKVFDTEVSDPSKLSSRDAWEALQAAVAEANKKLDNIQQGISQEIDSIDKAEDTFRRMLDVVNGIADRIKPGGTFDGSLDKLAQGAENSAKEASENADPEVQRQAQRFRDAAKGYLEVKADAAVQYQKALSTAKNLGSNKSRVVNEIKLASHAKAAELCRQFVNEAKASLGAVQPFTPKQSPAVSQ